MSATGALPKNTSTALPIASRNVSSVSIPPGYCSVPARPPSGNWSGMIATLSDNSVPCPEQTSALPFWNLPMTTWRPEQVLPAPAAFHIVLPGKGSQTALLNGTAFRSMPSPVQQSCPLSSPSLPKCTVKYDISHTVFKPFTGLCAFG